MVLTACPVCEGEEIAELWRLPQNRLAQTTFLDAPGTSMHRLYLDYLPTLRVPQEIFKFDICGRCESIFLNPKHDDQASYVDDASKVASFRVNGLAEFRGGADFCIRAFPPGAKVIVDAACGAGQVLHLIKQANPQMRTIGLELSRPSVAFMNQELGLEAYVADLDNDDLDDRVAPGTVDFIIFQEAFEHVAKPLTVMRKLARMLRPGGRMHFTAQYYGDNDLQIRVGEPIFISRAGLDFVLGDVGLAMIDLKTDSKIRATVEKPGGPTPTSLYVGDQAAGGDARVAPLRTVRRPWYRRVSSSIRRRLGLKRRKKLR